MMESVIQLNVSSAQAPVLFTANQRFSMVRILAEKLGKTSFVSQQFSKNNLSSSKENLHGFHYTK